MEGVTRESTKPLLELQRIDGTIDRLNARRADLPEQRELDERAAARDAIGAELTERATELERASREQAKLDGEVEQVETKIESETKRLYSGEVSSPRELANIQAELDALRRRKAHLEDQDLEAMEVRETLETEVGDLRKRMDEAEAEVAEATARRDAATVEIDNELGALRRKRDGIVPTVDPELLEFYEDLRKKFRGVAVGALEDGTCRACSLPLSPAALDEIKHSDDPFIRCENCRRLLVIS